MKLHPRVGVSAALTLAAAAALAQGERIYGMTAANSLSTSPGLGLVYFDSRTPGSVTHIGPFSGVVAGHALRSIDFRPATGQLYAISTRTTALDDALLYSVDLDHAALQPVGTGFTLAGNTSPLVELEFDPTTDRIRIVIGATTGNNYRADPVTGALVQADANLAYASGDTLAGRPPVIVAAAYTNNVPGALFSTLYAFDYRFDALVRVGGVGGTPSASGGALTSIDVPPDFITENPGIGMDISGATNTLYMVHDLPNPTVVNMQLYTVDLATGAQTAVGAFPDNLFVVDIAVAPIPEPAPLALGLAGLLGLVLLRRRLRQHG